jgi:hypothetical protein
LAAETAILKFTAFLTRALELYLYLIFSLLFAKENLID